MKESKTLIGICIFLMVGIIFEFLGVFNLIYKNLPVLIINCVAIVIIEVCGGFAIKEIRRLSLNGKSQNKTDNSNSEINNKL